ncbi:hypothetical protein [uncultured Pseudoteredinibacter sp.]|uniref:hypothetical protein n=1 Tax=uncultured Pseudoteredinibacter sp. TaxID=1641701 RepID=UPI00261FB07A|nr:hypothetical protein [uncultured Pseudoteredinibacter sp.]
MLQMNHLSLTETKVEGDKLYLMGIINSKSYEQMKTVIESNPQVKTLVLTVMPGSIDDETNLQMCHFVRNQGLSTYLRSDSVIASGAVDLFMSGVEREMESGAQLGVHSWSDGFQEALEYPRTAPEHKPYRDFYQAMVGSDDFYWYTLEAAKADDIHWMSEKEISAFPVLTQPLKKAKKHNDIFPKQTQIREEMLSDF